MDSQSGLLTLWTQGDVVTRALALLLFTMSASSRMEILIKALGPRKFAAQARGGSGSAFDNCSTVLLMCKA